MSDKLTELTSGSCVVDDEFLEVSDSVTILTPKALLLLAGMKSVVPPFLLFTDMRDG